jgi:hypothetical protein
MLVDNAAVLALQSVNIGSPFFVFRAFPLDWKAYLPDSDIVNVPVVYDIAAAATHSV